jgi:hypothetical protein
MSYRKYYLVHHTDRESPDEFFGPFESKEMAQKCCDRRGMRRDATIVTMDTHPYPLKYEGYRQGDLNTKVANGFIYNGIYKGPFRSQYSLMKAVVENGDAEHMVNDMNLFEMWVDVPE